MELLRVLNRWRAGILKIRVSGFFSERFLNICSANRIEIWDLEPERDGFLCQMTLPAFWRIRPFARKAKVRVQILGRSGFPFFLQRNRKRTGLFLGLASFFLLLYILSLFIWNISFEGNSHYTRENLLGYLESEGIRYGMRKKGISCEQLEENIRSRFPEITWVSARVSGTRLLIKIKENEVLFSIPQKDESPCDLVAEKRGTITSMIVRQGKAQVAVGDTVEQGQVLVASKLPVMNDSGEVVRNAYVHADADVWASTEYTYQETLPRLYTVSVKTGRKRPGGSIRIGPWQWVFLFPVWGDNPWNYVSETTQLCLMEDFYLPVYFEQITGEEYISYERPYTSKEAQEAARGLEEKYIKNLLQKGVQIIENNVKIQENGSFYIIEGQVAARERIAIQQPVADMEQPAPKVNEETTEIR